MAQQDLKINLTDPKQVSTVAWPSREDFVQRAKKFASTNLPVSVLFDSAKDTESFTADLRDSERQTCKGAGCDTRTTDARAEQALKILHTQGPMTVASSVRCFIDIEPLQDPKRITSGLGIELTDEKALKQLALYMAGHEGGHCSQGALPRVGTADIHAELEASVASAVDLLHEVYSSKDSDRIRATRMGLQALAERELSPRVPTEVQSYPCGVFLQKLLALREKTFLRRAGGDLAEFKKELYTETLASISLEQLVNLTLHGPQKK